MGPVEKQLLLCTWHVLRNWFKNLNKINIQDKKDLVFKTLKALMPKTNDNDFFTELSEIMNQLENDNDMADFGRYFRNTYLLN